MKLADGKVTLHAGDCLEVLATLDENSIDAVVTDPPYELGFMGKSWDASGIAFCADTWRLVWRVLKPGGHLVAFGAPKNYHRLACAIEDAGFEIRDSLMWVFGSGFPKSLDVSKAIDKAAGAERTKKRFDVSEVGNFKGRQDTRPWIEKAKSQGFYETAGDEPVTDAASEWVGWGTALKPAYEPIVLARKPLSEKTVAANVLRWGTGALNIDATRVSLNGEKPYSYPNGAGGLYSHEYQQKSSIAKDWNGFATKEDNKPVEGNALGRWPANLCHDGSQEVLDLFPQAGGGFDKRGASSKIYGGGKGFTAATMESVGYGDEGSAARFFYCAKASKHDRAGSKHPTVKPINLMRWLVRMVTPPGGTVLDPFAGSGTTGLAAVLEGFDAQLIEREAEYQADIQRRFDD